jgi:DNA-binding phage protein
MKRKTDKVDKSKQKDIIPETIGAIVASPTLTQAAEELGLSRGGLYKRINENPEIMKTINAMPETALAILKRGSVKAAETLLEGLTDKDSSIKYKVAGDVLDRVGVTNKTPTVAQQFNIGEGMKVEFTDDVNQTPPQTTRDSE